jgi:hypothetical protein
LIFIIAQFVLFRLSSLFYFASIFAEGYFIIGLWALGPAHEKTKIVFLAIK